MNNRSTCIFVLHLNNMPQDLILGAETNEADSNAQSGDGVEASVHEVTELISTDSTTTRSATGGSLFPSSYAISDTLLRN